MRDDTRWLGRGRPVPPRKRAQSLVILGLMLCCCGCGYPRVSPEAFDAAKAIDNLCNLRNPAQLPKARELVAQRQRAGEITASEAAMLQEILDLAEAEQWEQASHDARRLLEAQNNEL